MNLKKIGRLGAVDKKFKKNLRSKLDQSWQTKYGSKNFWYQTTTFRYLAVSSLVILFLVTGSLSAYAYASPQVTENSRLYPIKQVIERIEERVVSRNLESKVNFYLRQAQRREAELAVMKQKQEVISNKTEQRIEIIDQNLKKAQEWFDKKEINNPSLKAQVEKRLQKREEVLEQQIERLEKKNTIKNKAVNTSTEKRLKNNNSIRLKSLP